MKGVYITTDYLAHFRLSASWPYVFIHYAVGRYISKNTPCELSSRGHWRTSISDPNWHNFIQIYKAYKTLETV